jgi:hypothetical protein
MTKDTIEAIARVAHEVNKAYCEAIGDYSQLAWPHTSAELDAGAGAGVELHLNNPNMGPSASHDAWMAHKLANGWTYGPVKDETKKEHPCLVPFSDLPKEQQIKDFIFRGVVHAIAREMNRP